MTAAPLTCPRCAGRGEHEERVYGIREGQYQCWWHETLCRQCDGLGFIDAATAARLERGRLLREDRVARRVGLAEEARRLGMSPCELAHLEGGRSDASR